MSKEAIFFSLQSELNQISNRIEEKYASQPTVEMVLNCHLIIFSCFCQFQSMVDYAPAEISAVEQYEALLDEQAERKAIRRRQLEVDRVELKRKIQEAVDEFDAKLLGLYKTRLAIEKCILAEELKILLCDRRMSIQDQIDREEERLL